MAIKVIGSVEEFNQEIASGTVLVDFYADWCGPCQALLPILEKTSEELTDVNIVKVNVDNLPDVAGTYQVVSIPTMIVFKDGELVEKHTGVMQRDEIITWVNSKK